MKALKWYAPYNVKIEEAEEPEIVEETDAIIRTTLAGICGTDLHVYRGHVQIVPGNILGHEFVGIVEKIGRNVKNFEVGDRVVVSCWIADGTCWYCKNGFYTQCNKINIFGLGPLYGEEYPGAHAELVRVPNADLLLFKIPSEVEDEKVFALSDGLPASYAGIVEGNFKPGYSVAVLGFGPIGAMAAMCAKSLGAGKIFAVDIDEERLKLARELGFTSINSKEVDASEEIRNYTEGRGADLVVEAIGASEEVIKKAIELVRRKGTVSVVGMHVHDYNMPVGQLLVTEKRLVFVIGDTIKYRNELIELIKNNRIDISKIISHRIKLEEAPHGYEIFDKKKSFKVVIKP